MSFDTTGGGGDTSNIGNSSVDQATQVSTPEPATPTVIDVDPETMVRIKGQDKPVKFGEYSRGFQSQFTRASQKAAQLQRELEQERQQRQRYEQERAQAQRQSQQGQGGQADIYGKLRELPYLTGEEAVNVVQSIGREIQQRDYIIAAALKEMHSLKQLVSGLHENHTNTAFEGKVSRFLGEMGYDANNPGLRDLAKEIYLAYEGEDLDYEFPRIFGERMAQMEKFFQARRESAIRQAKPNPFVPGKGGQASPSKPLQLDPRASARETADALWDSLQNSGS